MSGVTVVRARSRESRDVITARLREEGLSPHTWGNGPGYVYDEHSHPYHKILYCLSGSITFHTPEGSVVLKPGDRLELAKGVSHGATVAEAGVECVEAAS